jgi:Sensors of blue-light using FAD
MAMIQLIYASRPFGFEASGLNGILSIARHCNTRDGVTGALICREDIYLQLLEGPEPMVEAAYGRIAVDDRHLDVTRLSCRPIRKRLFPDWAMRDDPARTWLWTAAEVEDGAATRASGADLLAVFQRLSAEPADGKADYGHDPMQDE